MNQSEEIQQLQAELQVLQLQIKDQYKKLTALQNRLQALLPESKPVKQKGWEYSATFSLENYIGLRLIHFIGIIVLVIGLSIGIKYAIDRDLISEGTRILLAYAAGVTLLVLSIRLKKKYGFFSAILFSGAVASLYFTTYGAFVFYAIIPFAAAYALMLLLTVFTVYRAIGYNLQLIAVLGLIGGYAIPFLISSNNGNPALLFLYILVIDCSVVYLGQRQQWTATVLVAMGCTWLLYFAWQTTKMSDRYVITATVFLIIFFVLFYIFSLREKSWAKGFEDWRLQAISINNLALYMGLLSLSSIYLNIQAAAVTFGMSAFLAVQASFYYKYGQEETLRKRLLYAAFTLFVVAIAMRWDGMAVTLLWLLISVVVFLIGVVKKWPPLRITAMLLMAATLGKLLLIDSARFTAVQKVIAYVLLGVLLLLVSFFYQKFKQTIFGAEEGRAPE